MITLLSVALAIPTQEVETNEHFTVNLLTRVGDMSIISPDAQIAVSFENATTQRVYEGNVTYSVIGSTTFNQLRSPKTYHIDDNQWTAEVSLQQ
jgi:hypothetical protein